MIPRFRNDGIPLEAQHLYRCAQEMKDYGKNEDAVNYLKMAVLIAPRFSKAYNIMANCLDEMGRFEEAKKKYKKVLEINPDHTEAQFKLELIQKKIQSDKTISPTGTLTFSKSG
jgi:tetratricopeptide (TPR) repeat protein